MRIPPPVAVGAGITALSLALYGVTQVPAQAAAPAAAPPTEVRGATSAEILHLSALSLPGLGSLADAGVGISAGSVDGSASPRTTADASNLGVALAEQALPDLLATASQEAPPDHASPATARSIEGEIPGLLSLGVSTTTAQARWLGNAQCPAPGTPLTSSTVSTADAATDETPGLGSLLTLPGTASTSQRTTLAGGDVRRVVSTAQGSAADLSLFGGAVQLDVADEPTLTATATGRDGGASVEWNAPLVRLTVNGDEREIPVDGSPVDIVSPDNPLLHLELSLGQLEDVRESADGTRASGEASVLHLEVSLGTGALGVTVLDTDLFPLTASATAPRGGVDCGSGSRDSDGDGLTDDEETSGSANDAFGNRPTDPQRADSDGDGLTDGQEVSGSRNDAFGHAPSNPNRADTDGGGVPDGDEVGRDSDPNEPADDGDGPGGTGDADGDGLTDAEETSGSENDAFGNAPTDPARADSDGDGLTDGEETSGSENDAFGNQATDPNEADTDGGGVADAVEVDRGTDPNDPADDGGTGGPNADPDQDGLTNQEEAEAGTDPTVPDTDAGGVNDGDEVDAGTDPLNPADDNGGGDPSLQDPDGDGLDTAEELEAGTNPLEADTDGDGLDDGEEVKQYQTQPDNPDTDGDGLTDGREVSATGTRPRDADTDNDGLKDGREVKRTKTNPKRKDTDRDGLGDGKEVFGPAKQDYPRCRTNPLRKDTDKDGLQDGRELRKYHTNPCNPDSDNGGVSDGDEIKAGSDPNDPRSTPKHPRVSVTSLLRPTG